MIDESEMDHIATLAFDWQETYQTEYPAMAAMSSILRAEAA